MQDAAIMAALVTTNEIFLFQNSGLNTGVSAAQFIGRCQTHNSASHNDDALGCHNDGIDRRGCCKPLTLRVKPVTPGTLLLALKGVPVFWRKVRLLVTTT